MGKNIAVLMGSINMENQKHIMDGMIDATKETQCNLYIFTNHSYRQNNSGETAKGAYQIMELPDFEYYDGVIVAPDTILYPPVASFVMDKIRNSKIPFISLDHAFEGHGCLLTSSYDAQYKVVEHLIKEHGCKEIGYIRGPIDYYEADTRYQAYCDALKDHNLPVREENIEVGGFTLESGLKAAIQLHQKGLKVDAIACANDSMALGAVEYFKMAGVSVPKDVLVTGFDNSESAMYSTPSITSIDKNPYDLGHKAIYEILDIIAGKEPECIKVSTEPACRESCGCGTAADVDTDRLKYRYMQKEIYINHLSELINANLIQFSTAQSPEEVVDVVKQTISRIDLKAFYLCLCDTAKVFALPESNMGGDFDLQQVNTDYTEKLELPLAFENKQVGSYKAFSRGIVLPQEIRDQAGDGNYYVITPIYFQSCCYGYAVSGNDKLALMNSLYYSWLMNIGVALENVRKKMLLQDAVIKLNNVWSYDPLTHLYNRAGFYYEAKTILEILKLQDSKIFVLFSDVDGLKKVNDGQGHEAGDCLIKEIAACFKENLSGDMLAMRYGGDEFVVFGSYEEEAEIDYLLKSIQASMDNRNASGKNTFTLSASIGVIKSRAQEVKELSELIDIADANMYEQKRKKREGSK